jgi:hypothetical protein
MSTLYDRSCAAIRSIGEFTKNGVKSMYQRIKSLFCKLFKKDAEPVMQEQLVIPEAPKPDQFKGFATVRKRKIAECKISQNPRFYKEQKIRIERFSDKPLKKSLTTKKF